MNDAQKYAPTLSIIFSFRNEEEVLSELLQAVRKVLTSEQHAKHICSYELIFVNDASTDQSLDLLIKENVNHNDIKIITMSRRFGVSPCVIAGLEHSRGDLIIYMDADLQDPPELIPEMIKAWREGQEIDIVHTKRLSRAGESPIKLAITNLGYWIINRFSDVKIPTEAGDFKLLTRRALNHVLSLKEKRPYLRGLVCWIGFHQTFVEYHRHKRFAGKTKFPIFSADVLSNFFDSALISFSSVPLKIASILGLMAIGIDFIVMWHAFAQKIQGQAVPGWTAIMIVTLFLGGVQLFCIGMLGLYLNAVYEQTKNRPHYIIHSTIGFKENEQ